MGGTLTGAIAGTNSLLMIVGIAGGGTAVYFATSADNAIINTEISLVAVLSGVAVANLAFGNFTNGA
jgi:aspartate oxidase